MTPFFAWGAVGPAALVVAYLNESINSILSRDLAFATFAKCMCPTTPNSDTCLWWENDINMGEGIE